MEFMKTEQEQIKAIKKIIDERVETTLGQVQGRHDNVIKTVDTVIIARDIVNAGYGDVSEYKAEIEQLKAKNKVLGDGVVKAFTNGFNTGREQVEKDIRRAKINAMIELKEKIVEHMGEREYMGVKYKQGVFSESEIDEFIKEIEEQ